MKGFNGLFLVVALVLISGCGNLRTAKLHTQYIKDSVRSDDTFLPTYNAVRIHKTYQSMSQDDGAIIRYRKVCERYEKSSFVRQLVAKGYLENRLECGYTGIDLSGPVLFLEHETDLKILGQNDYFVRLADEKTGKIYSEHNIAILEYGKFVDFMVNDLVMLNLRKARQIAMEQGKLDEFLLDISNDCGLSKEKKKCKKFFE